MKGVAPILLRFVSVCLARVWPAGRPCVLARVRPPVLGTVGVGGWRRGGVWRTGPAGFPPRVPRHSRGGRLPWPWGGQRVGAPLARLQYPAGRRGGSAGERGGRGRAVVPLQPPPIARPGPSAAEGGLACSPRPRPPLMAGGVAPRVPPCCVLGRGCSAAPGARRGLAGLRWVSLVGGAGSVGAPLLVGSPAGGPRVAGGGGSLCLRLSICPPPGGHQGGPFRRCPVPRTAPARVRVPLPGCGPRGALARRRRAAGLPRVLWEWAGG